MRRLINWLKAPDVRWMETGGMLYTLAGCLGVVSQLVERDWSESCAWFFVALLGSGYWHAGRRGRIEVAEMAAMVEETEALVERLSRERDERIKAAREGK